MKRLGIQVYTLREYLNTDESCAETLKKLHEMGCHTVQLCGGLEYMERCAKYCKENDLTIIGTLVSLDLFENDPEPLFDFCRRYGLKDIGFSSGIKTREEALDYIKRVNAFAQVACKEGFTVSYHNHSNEFIRTDCGKTVMDLLIEGFDAEKVNFMPDTYWVQHGGADVRHFLETIRGRAKILHLKDMKRGENGPTFAEVGQGNLWFEAIIPLAEEIGVEDFVIEQDICDGDPLDSVRMSCAWLQEKGLIEV